MKLELPEALCPEVSASFARPFARANRGYPSSLFDPCPRLSDFRRIRAERSPRVLSGWEQNTTAVFVVFLGILWNRRCREVPVECSRSRRSHGRPEMRGSSSQCTDIRRTHGPRDISTIRERIVTKIAHCLLLDGKCKSGRVIKRKKVAVHFFTYVSSAPGELLKNSRNVENGEHFGDWKDEVREISRSSNGWRSISRWVSEHEVATRRRDRRDGVRNFPIGIDDDPSTAA